MFDQFIPQSIAFSIGSVAVHWYGLIMAMAIGIAYVFVVYYSERAGLSKKTVQDALFYAIIFGLIGARLYHVIGEFSYYSQNPGDILVVWRGGLAIHGALIGGFAVIWWFYKKHNLRIWKFLDITALAVVFGQALGRWGNFFNQELFGTPTSLPWKLFISPENRISGYEQFAYFHPTFLYESLLNFVLFIVLFILYKKKQLTDGSIFLLYIIGYSLVRFFLEFIRLEPVVSFAGLRAPQIVSLLLIAGAFVLLYRKRV